MCTCPSLLERHATIQALQDDREHVRVEAAATLGDLGPLARDAAGPLTKLLEDASPPVRTAAKKALERIDK